MSRPRFELNLPGLNELMKSSEMQAVLNQTAARVAARAGDGFAVEGAHPISFVAITSVKAATAEARRACNQRNALDKACGGKV